MKYDLFDLLNSSIMTGIPVVFVEGKDDPQIYVRISKSINKDIEVYPINTIEDYSSGCDNVIKAVNKLQIKFSERVDNEYRVLGIIDRDVRPYRELSESEINFTTLKGLFILRYYSIETYFATKRNAGKIIEKLTYLSTEMIDNDLLQFVEADFVLLNPILYLVSLEALKNACTRDYATVVGYNDDRIKDTNRIMYLYLQIETKKSDLELFASQKGISFDDIKKICKGKWYLFHYVNKLNDKIKTLQTHCQNNQIKQCKSCEVQHYEDCYYKYKAGYQINGLCNDIFEYVDTEECDDIIQRFNQLI